MVSCALCCTTVEAGGIAPYGECPCISLELMIVPCSELGLEGSINIFFLFLKNLTDLAVSLVSCPLYITV